MIMKRLSLMLILVLLSSLLFVPPLSVAEERKTYIETKLEVPEGSLLIVMHGGSDGSILALATTDDGAYHLLRWKELSSMPEVIPISITDMEISAIDVAPDGEIALTAIREAREPNADGILSMETVIVWIDSSGEESSRVIIDDIVSKQKALSGKRIACASLYNELVIYDDMGNALMRESLNGLENLFADDGTLYGFTPGKVYQWSLDSYNKTNSKSIQPLYMDRLTMSSDGTIYFIGEYGIYQLDLESGEAQMIMNKLGTCLGDWHFYIQGFVALPDNLFILHAQNLNAAPPNAHLQENNFIAIYRETENIQNKTPFVINTMFENLLLQTASSEFQRLHPELIVELHSFMNRETGDMPIEDLIRTMNTELLAGKGGDVLLLDRLPIEAIISRGMLLDISHIADDIQFLQGVSKSIRQPDGKVYTIPAELGIYQLWGKKSAIDLIKTLPDILNAPLEPGQMRLPMSAQLRYLFAACKQDFTNDKGDILFQSQEFIDFLSFLYSIYFEIESEAAGITDESRIIMDQSSLRNEAIAFYFDEAAYFYNVLDYYNQYGKEESAVILMPSMNGSGSVYRPKDILSIPSNAKNPSLSEEFIRLVLSDEMQLQSVGFTGFSTVEKKLDALFEMRIEMSNDETRNQLYSQDENGVRISRAPSEGFYRNMRKMFDEVSIPVYNDSTILMFIQEGIDALLDGTSTAEEAAQDIERRAFLYINE